MSIDPFPVSLGVHHGHRVYLCYSSYGYYLEYNGENYSIPDWAKGKFVFINPTGPENLNESYYFRRGEKIAIKIIDYKIKSKI
jgi:hypothetical protein